MRPAPIVRGQVWEARRASYAKVASGAAEPASPPAAVPVVESTTAAPVVRRMKAPPFPPAPRQSSPPRRIAKGAYERSTGKSPPPLPPSMRPAPKTPPRGPKASKSPPRHYVAFKPPPPPYVPEGRSASSVPIKAPPAHLVKSPPPPPPPPKLVAAEVIRAQSPKGGPRGGEGLPLAVTGAGSVSIQGPASGAQPSFSAEGSSSVTEWRSRLHGYRRG